MLNRKIAILGLSANPPHFGHQAVCFWLRETLNVGKVIVVPVYQHIFEKQLESFEHRIKMCQLMIESIKHNNVYVSSMEKVLPIPNTTYDLLDYFKIQYNIPLVLVIGSDLLKEITKWHRWQELPSLATILVVERPGSEMAVAPFDVVRYSLNIAPTSSTAIREMLANGEPVDGLLSHRVLKYIRKNKLYGT